MAGSKKGEKRGAAREGYMRKQKTNPPIKPQRHSRGTARKHTEEYMRDIVSCLNKVHGGDHSLQPRDMLKFVQDHHHGRAIEGLMRLKLIEGKIFEADPTDRPAMEGLARDWMEADREVTMHLGIAGEAAFKNLPYYHSKVAPDPTGEVGSPIEFFAQMIREIEELGRGRPTWMPGQLKLVSSK